ncbi:hypothetical protein [Hyphomicrobium sp.]|jgi:hypothetical protein|uniref:hypothetical protein n=1 Tax=Hyphomicrobium sp. TaxID=82 RepID=UPI002C9B2356|nr:hypothetical protein [Hyphomicrobium sp.]HVZ03946.1 hypothetical protein [Hyphomicrobium sp.]
MEQRAYYTRVADLLALARGTERASETDADCQNGLRLLEQIFHCVDDMGTDERQAFMKRLAALLIGKKHGPEKDPMLIGLHRYCVATSLIEDPSWEPPLIRL